MAHKGEKENGSHYSSSGATKNVYSKKKRTSFVNDNSWWSKLAEGMKGLQPYSPQKMVRRMGERGKSAVSMKIEERDRTGEAGWRRHIKKWDKDADKKLIDSVIGGGGKKGPNWKNYIGDNQYFQK